MEAIYALISCWYSKAVCNQDQIVLSQVEDTLGVSANLVSGWHEVFSFLGI